MSGMKPVDLYARVRYACHVEGLSQRETARRFGIDTKTVRKMLTFAVPPGYRRSKPPARPKLDPFTPTIDRILARLEQCLRVWMSCTFVFVELFGHDRDAARRM